MIADLLTGDRGYQVIQQLPGIGPVLAAVIIAETGLLATDLAGNAARLCSWAGLIPLRYGAYRLDQSWKLRGPQIRVRGSSVKS